MIDIYGLGNAIVDTEYRVSSEFLKANGIGKGLMTLVDGDQLTKLTEIINQKDSEKTSGGSAANTIITAQHLGANTYYSCKVGNDEIGQFFMNDLRKAGIQLNRNTHRESGRSGQCLVFVTEDAERSMNTCLGISDSLNSADINKNVLERSRYLYIEGYLGSSETATSAAIEARQTAENAGVKTVVTLSDPSIVRIFQDNLEKILGNGVDHLFCNEEEALAWAESDRLDIAINELKDVSKTLNITLGEKGSMFVENGKQFLIPGFPARAVDTNGAGDIYAGATIFGWCRKMDPVLAAELGNRAAATLVEKYGARLKSREEYQEILRTHQLH